MTRNLTRLSLSVLALAASGAVAQQSDDSGAAIAADTREMLQGTAPEAGAETTPPAEAAPAPQGESAAPASNASSAQPETLRMLESSPWG